ncbi:MAG: endonuclease/exonuclease/phosphatase family protein [Saccharospirillaceae bacterium]|nr:endonuclease/exonuclease/phosphatase family protein [Saccharospirillaceae bacterium]
MNSKTNNYGKNPLHTAILSWNIQSPVTVNGPKVDDQNFLQTIIKHDIICLQEIRRSIKVPGFRSFCNLRQGEKHGGVGILYKNELSPGVQRIKNTIGDIIACKLKKSFFNVSSDIIIINAYVKPANTSSKTYDSDGQDTLKQLDNLVSKLREQGEVILCGDFNSRIATEPDYIEHDSTGNDNFVPLPDDYVPDNLTKRNSEDKKTNSYKRPFLELLINNHIHILNGRTLGDLKGSKTCIQYGGSSVVDYFIASAAIKKYIRHMNVMPFTIYSDHKPIALNLKLGHENVLQCKNLNDYDKAPLRYKFDDTSKLNYQNIQCNPDLSNLSEDIMSKNYNTNSDDIYKLNSDITSYMILVAEKSLTKTKHAKNKFTNKKPWFNHNCRVGKRELNKASRIVTKFPDSEFLRNNYYRVKKTYKKLITTSKLNFFEKLNRDIEQGKVINWKQFKRLKEQKSFKSQFDGHDMNKFEIFFENLYSSKNSPIPEQRRDTLLEEADKLNETAFSTDETLNKEITLDEVKCAVNSLKNGKSSSCDMICNEMIKNLLDNGIYLLAKLFNHCLDAGCYPWNNSIITPLHKKGDREDPDNYRAIAVSSTIGKLFSTILLERFIKFRTSNCPDPPNQLGFTKGAQTYDHILTLNTITSKYKRKGKKVFAVYVDFKKAFDSVCREALFYKLAMSNIRGKFYNVLRHMYSHSTGQIKLSNHVSNTFSVSNGTEQGHPLSPDLFKLYLHDLSPLLEFDDCPELLDKIISHLLWADDLIILALNEETLQNQLTALNNFCTKWGLSINVSKTKLMVFNETTKNSNVNAGNSNSNVENFFYIGDKLITEVESYCYLGITIHKSGNLSIVRLDLKQKAMRALYSLKSTVNKTKVSTKALCNLFDALIKPIALYGAPIWTPSMSIIKHISKTVTDHNLIKKMALLNSEKLHLHFLKWMLGINRRASNIATWGETGRYPLIYDCLTLTLNYIQRLKSVDPNSFVGLAFQEQQNLKLAWYNNIEEILKIDPRFTQDHVTAHNSNNNNNDYNNNHTMKSSTKKPSQFLIHNGFVKYISSQITKPSHSKFFNTNTIIEKLKLRFDAAWSNSKNNSPKLTFYNNLKSTFNRESYLTIVNNYRDRSNLTKLRTSAHELEIEMGRRKGLSRNKRHCKWCLLSMNKEILEDEIHLLNVCDLYAILRETTQISMIKAFKPSTTDTTTPSYHLNSNNDHYHADLTEVFKIDTYQNHPHKRDLNHFEMHSNQNPKIAFSTLARFVTSCFNRRKIFVKQFNKIPLDQQNGLYL